MNHDGYDAIILGAGGAGLMCAAMAGQRGKGILVIDHAKKPGKKILISGGGRCNFTNIGATSRNAQERYLSQNPHFAKSALSRYTPQDFVDLVDNHGIKWHEKTHDTGTLGQLFCDDSAKQIVDMLLAECAKADTTGGHVDLHFGDSIREVSHADGHYQVRFGDHLASAPALVIATGGPSIPKMGASGFAYELARQFGLKIVEPRPALVPFTLGGEDILFRELSGVSADVETCCGKTRFREAALFTHKGLSGPSILQISSYWKSGDAIDIDFLPDEDASKLLIEAKEEKPKATIRSTLADHLPARLSEALAEKLGLHGNLADQANKKLEAAGQQLSKWPFHPNGTEGFAKAEVTIGGISTEELSQKTMEAKRIPGLYCIGEAVDVTGWLGGYNFQWAWASGFAAGEAI